MQDKKARAVNAANFGVNPAKTPIRRRDINTICRYVGSYLTTQGFQAPDKTEPVRSLLVAKLMNYALRDNSEDPKGYCAVCRKWHTIPISVPCPVNPERHGEIELKFWNSKDDANSIAAGVKMMDKLFPNLAAITGTINVEGTISTVSAEMIKVIVEYVPAEKRQECFQKIDAVLAHLQETGVDDVPTST